jgi:hypothetical protein
MPDLDLIKQAEQAGAEPAIREGCEIFFIPKLEGG